MQMYLSWHQAEYNMTSEENYLNKRVKFNTDHQNFVTSVKGGLTNRILFNLFWDRKSDSHLPFYNKQCHMAGRPPPPSLGNSFYRGLLDEMMSGWNFSFTQKKKTKNNNI